MILLINLGGPALFEPDEGRNAEKAREIVLLGEWTTPHENFLPVLDKPIFHYWLIAISYKLFGLTEWSARLPSALTALGCLFLVYRFARVNYGMKEALWSTFILVTSAEFFILAGVVILDMTLTFFITLALYGFYRTVHSQDGKEKKIYCVLLYGALGGGTLVKGLIGLIVPGTVFFFYLLLTNKWSSLRALYLLPGALLYLAIVAPWYLWAEAANPGYLRYYFWDEHFTRYLTEEFDRSKGWYYFFFVLAVGFLPWTVLLPTVIKKLWHRLDDKNLYLILWVILPFAFFSVSRSQLPHYILPIFPALAILTGQALGGQFHEVSFKELPRLIYWPWAIVAGGVLYLILGTVWPNLLAREIRPIVSYNTLLLWLCGLLLFILYAAYALGKRKGFWREQWAVYFFSVVGMAIFLFLVAQIKEQVSMGRTAKTVALGMGPLISAENQVVFYDTYLPGMLFYLQLDRPIWVVAKPGKSARMISKYVSRASPETALSHGKILFSFEEFKAAWEKTKRPLLVVVKAKNLSRMKDDVGTAVKEFTKVDEYVVVGKP